MSTSAAGHPHGSGSSRHAPPPIVGEGYSLSDKQRKLLELVATLGRERFAARAARYDRDASFPFENYDDLRGAGLLGICVPERYGGLGADYATYAIVAAEMGRHCAATTLTFNMHVCSTLWTGALADDLDMTPEQRDEHERHRRIHFMRIVRQGKIYAQPFSEANPAAAAGKAPFGTLARKVDGGWVLNGKKIFASLAGAADYYGVLCTEEKAERSLRDTLYLAVPAEAPGLAITGDWDPLGMRGTVSRTLLLQDVPVPDEAQLMPRGIYHQAAMRWPHMFFTLAPTYMGIAQAAYDFTVRYLRGEVPEMPVVRRMYPAKQMAVAEMHITLEQTRALFLRALADARVDPPKDARLRAYAAQYTVMENANEICRLAIRTCGGHSILRPLPLERLYRDSRCGSLMLPWTAELSLDRIGRDALYEPGEADD